MKAHTHQIGGCLLVIKPPLGWPNRSDWNIREPEGVDPLVAWLGFERALQSILDFAGQALIADSRPDVVVEPFVDEEILHIKCCEGLDNERLRHRYQEEPLPVSTLIAPQPGN